MYSYFLFLPSHSRRLTLALTSSALSPLTRSALQADTRDSAITPGLVVLVVRHLHSAVRKRGNKREKIKQRRKKKKIYRASCVPSAKSWRCPRLSPPNNHPLDCPQVPLRISTLDGPSSLPFDPLPLPPPIPSPPPSAFEYYYSCLRGSI